MFQVNRSENRLQKLEEKRFADLNLREREHLQEWLANQPDALGEELLIIQKEFDGFADTRERLDLLALDKDGQLVVIENKLDDSGRDVTWQALKYTAYVSGLTKSQIVDIYQQYLDRYCGGGNAVANICEFLEEEELDEIVLNPGNDQRLMFIAANFRKEVTATVLWLREHGIDARCFRVTPYTFGDELFVDIQPVIPTPEAADFMIGMAEKETEARGAQGEQKNRHKLRRDYWEMTLDALKEAGDTLYQNISPGKDHWLSAGSGLRSCPYALIFAKSEIRVEFTFGRADAVENKWLFDRLIEKKDEIEAAFGHEIEWLRLDNKKASRLQFGRPCEGYNREGWPEYVAWHVEHMQKWERALRGPLAELNQGLKSGENLI
ncbi:DUF4268 domain-containing protein [Parasulfitobacter algicola]|uniref:DUF4268 domain-containing protein n=1 Tax=Parasulfitobacter algicola TaxID=2614809 RepID=A0ABX2ISE1_9RHOB|nr:DUF4268 domain-containing protein [Sulfitobacter algicola]NSX53274.1 DUF4268 domain-containing protein [Sulfitobacter algicola]